MEQQIPGTFHVVWGCQEAAPQFAEEFPGGGGGMGVAPGDVAFL